MLRYIMMFVLVITMVKTNAQNQLLSTQSSDKLLVRLGITATQQDVASMLNKVSQDPDFSTNSDGTGGYFFLDKDPQSTITDQQAITNYMNESYVGSASFLFYDDNDNFHGITYDVIARGKSGVTETQMSTAAANLGMIQMSELIPELNMYVMYFDKTVDMSQISDDMAQTGLFEYAHPNILHEYTPNTIGDATNSGSNDCPILRPTTLPASQDFSTINDPFAINFSQWSIYTGYLNEFHNLINPPAPNSAEEFSDINMCHAWNFVNGSMKNLYPGADVNGYSQIENRPIYVAIIDDGVDTRHIDLNIRRRANGVSAYGCDAVEITNPNPNISRSNPIYNPSSPDDEGCPDIGTFPGTHHGTLCAGIIAAKRDNTVYGGTYNQNTNPFNGMVGIAYEAELMPVRIAWKSNNTNPTATAVYDDVSINYGFKWATDEGADVLNCSFGVTVTSGNSYYIPTGKSREDAISYATTYGRGGNSSTNQDGKGCVVVFSAGNNNHPNIEWPSSNSNVISVGAMSMCNERKSTASCDAENWGSNHVDGLAQYYDISSTPYKALNTDNKMSVVAPGIRIVSTLHGNGATLSNSHATSYPTSIFNGTSSSAPHVSGVVALILSINPCLTYQEVKDIIELSAEKIQPNTGYSHQYSSWEANGPYDYDVGYGKLNAGNAITLAYDLYKQEKVETGTEIYHSSHYIFAGRNVTNILPVFNPGNPDYIVSNGADISFFAPTSEAIQLEPGFVAEPGSKFIAELQSLQCDNGHHHHKPSKPKNDGNIIATQPKLGGADDLIHGIKIYPNPAKDKINIEFGLDEDANVSFTMANLMGQTVKEIISSDFTKGKQTQSISLQGLAPGVYFVGIKTPSGYSQFRFIKD